MKNWFRPASLLAAIAILIAVAASRHSSEDPALKPRIAALQSELARLRAARAAPETAAAPESPASLPAEAASARDPSPSPSTPRRRLRAAGTIVDREEKLTLLRSLLRGSDAGLKSRALTMLRDLRGPDAVALAVDVLRNDGPSWLRAQAAGVLGEIADPSAISALLEAVQSDDLDVRAGAASSLDRLGHSAPLHDLIAHLTGMLDHQDRGKREDAVLLLSSLQTPAALPPLVRALGDATNCRVRESAAEALGRTRLPAAIPSLETALADPEASVREAARRAIESLRTGR